MKKIILSLAFCTFGLAFSQKIEESRLKEIITYLASDELKGRKAGTPENELAAKYIAEQFKKINWTIAWAILTSFHFSSRDKPCIMFVDLKKGKQIK